MVLRGSVVFVKQPVNVFLLWETGLKATGWNLGDIIMVTRPKTMTSINPRVKCLWWATPWKPAVAINTCIFPPSGEWLLVITGWKWVAKGGLHPETSLWLIWLPRLRWRQQLVCKHSHWAEWSGKANRKLLQSKSCTLLLKTSHFKRCSFYSEGFRFVLHFPVCFTACWSSVCRKSSHIPAGSDSLPNQPQRGCLCLGAHYQPPATSSWLKHIFLQRLLVGRWLPTGLYACPTLDLKQRMLLS